MMLSYGRQTIEEDDIEAVVRVLKSDYLTTGPEVAAFERELAAKVGTKWAVAVSSGTAALHAACSAVGVTAGAQVVVPAITFLATANCARYVGAYPVFADVDPNTGLIREDEIDRLVGKKTAAVIPVHLTGALAPLPEGVPVVEDAAHALGAKLSVKDVAIFSFHPVKHITTGEGGAVVGNDPVHYERILAFRNHGMIRKPDVAPWYYEQESLGHNFRMTDLQAALGRSQLKKLDRFVSRRRALAKRYDARLSSHRRVRPVPSDAYHLYSVLIEGVDRAQLMAHLEGAGIGTQVHYIPVPMQPYYREMGWCPKDFPGALRYYERTLSLPLFPAMDDSDVDRVVDALERGLEALG